MNGVVILGSTDTCRGRSESQTSPVEEWFFYAQSAHLRRAVPYFCVSLDQAWEEASLFSCLATQFHPYWGDAWFHHAERRVPWMRESPPWGDASSCGHIRFLVEQQRKPHPSGGDDKPGRRCALPWAVRCNWAFSPPSLVSSLGNSHLRWPSEPLHATEHIRRAFYYLGYILKYNRDTLVSFREAWMSLFVATFVMCASWSTDRTNGLYPRKQDRIQTLWCNLQVLVFGHRFAEWFPIQPLPLYALEFWTGYLLENLHKPLKVPFVQLLVLYKHRYW